MIDNFEEDEELFFCQSCDAEITENDLEVCRDCGSEHCTYCTEEGICSDCIVMAQELQDEEEDDDQD